MEKRQNLLSWFAYLIGGWNASPGSSVGRLLFEKDLDNDEKTARLLLDSHQRDCQRDLLDKIEKLKVRLFDQAENAQSPPVDSEAEGMALSLESAGFGRPGGKMCTPLERYRKHHPRKTV